uniref:Uncharacterized protein n=1 Tax=Candidatus Kentrum sp. TUN TaxID=2126343 RepID=A0A450ZSC6_9GAMM|nr:MAG: hypothetical protein BECKTUN1418F_GA0071002_109310 [Candidatus Kentron sp. TUN]VFK63394.1 MAG: hypothetical protein BECKTUN1418E_GA0071001_109110 [Candidatus Kentron sp. TUN]
MGFWVALAEMARKNLVMITDRQHRQWIKHPGGDSDEWICLIRLSVFVVVFEYFVYFPLGFANASNFKSGVRGLSRFLPVPCELPGLGIWKPNAPPWAVVVRVANGYRVRGTC